MVEEIPFGGEALGDKGSSILKPGDCRFILEDFSPKRELLRPTEWMQKRAQ